MKYVLKNAVIYTALEVLYGYAVVIDEDKICAILPEEDVDATLPCIDLEGQNLTAGFIDLQLNGCGGVMFNNDTSVRTLEIMQQTNLRSGTTSFLPTFITAPDEGIKQAVKVMREYLQKYQNQALGLHLEGPYLSVAKKGVHQAKYIREISPEMKQFLCQNADVITKITLAAENPTAQAIPDFVNSGIIVSLGHSNADYETAKKSIDNGIHFATHLHNAMSPISSGRDMGVVGAVLDSDIYCGIIVDGLHVNYGNVRIAKKIKGDKLCIVTDATAAAGAHIEFFQFVDKTVYVRDGKCYDANGTIGGSSITMIESLKNAVLNVGIPLDEAIRMCNYYPAKAIGVDQKLGEIEVGKIANLTVFDSAFQVKGVVLNGEWLPQ